MKIDSLHKLFVHELKDLWSAENQILDALPKMAEKADHPDLKKAFEDHLAETKEQVSRLETIFQQLDFEPGGHRCEGMAGLLEEGKDAMDVEDPNVRDAAMIAAAQRVEHYEMAGYGVASTYAEKMGHTEAANLLYKTLEEDGKADRLLSRMAERCINFEAMVAA